jgi:O-6-methylguanine DNA methyltransferase
MTLLLRREIRTPVGVAVAGVVEPGPSGNEPGGVCLLELGDEQRRERELAELESHFSAVFVNDRVAGGSRLLDDLERELNAYFAGDLLDFTLPLCTPGTRFQHSVWQAMRRIPFGFTTTYGRLARALGREVAASRAVGFASGRNRVSILVPCHRVVDATYDGAIGTDRGLRGYGGGIEIKRRLLEHERVIAGDNLFSDAPNASAGCSHQPLPESSSTS